MYKKTIWIYLQRFKNYQNKKLLILSIVILLLGCEFKKKPMVNMSLPLSSNFVGLTIVESDGSTDLFEGTTTDTYTVVLNANPGVPISIDVSFDSTQIKVNEQTSGTTKINFTVDNWNVPQTVSVYALYDNISEGTHKSKILHTVQSGNPFQGQIQVGTITATITDNSGSRLTNSFQSGNITLGATNPATVSLSRVVDSTKAYVYCNFRYSNSSVDRTATCQLSQAGDSVVIQAGTVSSNSYVNWYVVEFAIGASITRGSGSLLSSEQVKNISLNSSFDLSRTFVIGYSRGSVNNSAIDEQRTLRFRLTSKTNLEVYRNELGSQTDFEWQVIQLDGARVQSGTSTIASGSSSVTANISSVNLTNSFLLLNVAAGAGVNGTERNYLTRGYYNSSSQVAFERYGSTDSVDISWYAIELVDGNTAQSGNSSVSSSSSSITATLNTIDTTKTMIICSYQVEDGDTAITTQDSGTFSSNFLNSTTIQFDRFNAESNRSIITWFAIQYQ